MKINGETVYFDLTKTGIKISNDTALIVEKILGWIKQGKAPNELKGRRQIEMINFEKTIKPKKTKNPKKRKN